MKSSSVAAIVTALLIMGTIIWVGIEGVTTSSGEYSEDITVKAGWGSQVSGNQAEASTYSNRLPVVDNR